MRNLPSGDWRFVGLRISVDSVNLWGFYAIGGNVSRLNLLTAETKLVDANIALTDAEVALNYLLYDPAMVPLEECRGLGNTLWLHITAQIKRAKETPDAELGVQAVSNLKESLNAFDIVLRNALAFVPAYCVSQKGILSSQKLVNSADQMFNISILKRMPQVAIDDVKASGRCLAFNLPTATGFHILRALEAVVVDYIIRQTGKRPERRELGIYIAILKTQNASEDVTFIIDQIRRLHRNPLMHPEDILTPDEALDLFLLCRSSISTTISDMEA